MGGKLCVSEEKVSIGRWGSMCKFGEVGRVGMCEWGEVSGGWRRYA